VAAYANLDAGQPPTRLLVYLIKAVELLKPFNINIISSFQIPDEVVPFDQVVDTHVASGADVDDVRAAAERKRPGLTNTLRIIVCRFNRSSIELGTTFGGRAETNLALSHWAQDFILINSPKLAGGPCGVDTRDDSRHRPSCARHRCDERPF
jgi:hypothetical protein